jgi:hypothetical protein
MWEAQCPPRAVLTSLSPVVANDRGRLRVFLGTYAPRLDEKSRLVLSAKFREQFADGLGLAEGRERCLCIWSLTEFRPLTE